MGGRAYYESYPVAGGHRWKIYHYDPSGDNEVLVGRSGQVYDTADEAVDACGEHMDDNDIDAELA